MGTTIDDILDLLVDTGCQIRVWEDSKQKERDYDEDNDRYTEINSFDIYHKGVIDYIVFNID